MRYVYDDGGRSAAGKVRSGTVSAEQSQSRPRNHTKPCLTNCRLLGGFPAAG
jgi:hypothetical protein